MGASAEHPPSEHWGGAPCASCHICVRGTSGYGRGHLRPPAGNAVFRVLRDPSAPQSQLCSRDPKEPCGLSPPMARPTRCPTSGVRTEGSLSGLHFPLTSHSVISHHLLRESHQGPGSSLLWGGDRNASDFQQGATASGTRTVQDVGGP